MSHLRKIFICAILAVLLSFQGTEAFVITSDLTVEAAVKAPTVKEDSKTLYVGYESYKIEMISLSRSAVVTYKSSNSKIAYVSKSGTIKPIAKGSATITVNVKQSGKTYSLKMTVTVKEPSISITDKTDYLNVNEYFQFKAKTVGTKERVVWSVSDKSRATITSAGKLKAIKGGRVTVYAKTAGKYSKYQINIGTNRITTTSRELSFYDQVKIIISTKDFIEDETLTFQAEKGTKVVSGAWDQDWKGNSIGLMLSAENPGTDTITITSDKTKDQLVIKVTVTEPPIRVKLDPEDIYKKCGPATVEIVASDIYAKSQGSGFFINKGTVVTNYHVIEGANKIVVVTNDEKEYEVQKILGYSKELDIAILEVYSENDVLVITKDNPAVGQTVYAIGSPLGLTGTMTNGMITTASRVFDGVDYIQTNAAISPGNSGGPLVNAYGEVIGINTMYIIDGQNLNFSINIKELSKISTVEPITVAEYYAEYTKGVEKNYIVIDEDPSMSRYYDTSQFIPEGAILDGTLLASEEGDCYRFTVTKNCSFNGVILSESLVDMTNTYFYLYDSNITELKEAEEIPSEFAQVLSYDIAPGEYILYVTKTNNYYVGDMPYCLTFALKDE